MSFIATESEAEWCKGVYADPNSHTDAEVALAFSILAGTGIDTWARIVYNDENSKLDSLTIAQGLLHTPRER